MGHGPGAGGSGRNLGREGPAGRACGGVPKDILGRNRDAEIVSGRGGRRRAHHIIRRHPGCDLFVLRGPAELNNRNIIQLGCVRRIRGVHEHLVAKIPVAVEGGGNRAAVGAGLIRADVHNARARGPRAAQDIGRYSQSRVRA